MTGETKRPTRRAGSPRWYAARVPSGAERKACSEARAAIPAHLLADAFPIARERWVKRAGLWSLDVVPLAPGYAVAVTGDPAALARALSRSPARMELVGAVGDGWVPYPREAVAWFQSVMDGRGVIRSSTAEIVDGELRVLDGPLVGKERLVRSVDRHRRRCRVLVEDGGEGFTESLAIDVPVKRRTERRAREGGGRR